MNDLSNTLTSPQDFIQIEVSRAQSAIEQICQEAAYESSSICPRKSGALAGSIHMIPDGSDLVPGAVVLADKSYAQEVEFGNSKQSAQPFMRPVEQSLQYQLGPKLVERMK